MGKQIEEDLGYFEVSFDFDEYTTFYLCLSEKSVAVIGSGVEEMLNFVERELSKYRAAFVEKFGK